MTAVEKRRGEDVHRLGAVGACCPDGRCNAIGRVGAIHRARDRARVGGLDQGIDPLGTGRRRVGKDREAPQLGHQLDQQLLALPIEFVGENIDAGQVALGPGERGQQTAALQIVGDRDDGNRPGGREGRARRTVATGKDRVGIGGHDPGGLRRQLLWRRDRFVQDEIPSDHEAGPRQLPQRRVAGGRQRQTSQAIGAAGLLGPRRPGKSHRFRDPERQQRAPPDHSITPSARARIEGGTARPRALAVFMLMTSS